MARKKSAGPKGPSTRDGDADAPESASEASLAGVEARDVATVDLVGAGDDAPSEAVPLGTADTEPGEGDEEIDPRDHDDDDAGRGVALEGGAASPAEVLDLAADAAAVSGEALPVAREDEGTEPRPEYPGPARTAPRSVSELHLKGILESLVFVSDKPLTVSDLAKIARADARDVRRLLEELREEYRGRGVQLDEIAGGWQFRSSAANAPFVREFLQAKPVRLTRAQVETLAIIAYRQPITRPEVDEIRGVDSGSALKVLLERELVRILGRKEDVGRPVLYGTSGHFLEFFGLKSLRELPTLREFTDLTPESEATLVRELGDAEAGAAEAGEATPERSGAESPAAAAPGDEAAPVGASEAVEPSDPSLAGEPTDDDAVAPPPDETDAASSAESAEAAVDSEDPGEGAPPSG